MTKEPHVGGTIGEKKAADYIYKEWHNQGLDGVQMIDYDGLFSFPDDIHFNRCFPITFYV